MKKGYEFKNYLTKKERKKFIDNIIGQQHRTFRTPKEHLLDNYVDLNEFIRHKISHEKTPFSWNKTAEGFYYWEEIAQRTKPVKQK